MSGYLRVGIAQWTPEPEADVNLGTAEAAVLELARRGCQLAVLPELWLCGYRTVTLDADTRAAAEPLDGPVQRRLAAAARATGMVLCAGSFPELDGGQLFNTAVIYGPDGELLLRHRQVCLYGSEPTVFQAGSAVTAGDTLRTSAALTAVGAGKVTVANTYTGQLSETAADSVIMVTARLPDEELFLDLLTRQEQGQIASVRAIGDAWARAPSRPPSGPAAASRRNSTPNCPATTSCRSGARSPSSTRTRREHNYRYHPRRHARAGPDSRADRFARTAASPDSNTGCRTPAGSGAVHRPGWRPLAQRGKPVLPGPRHRPRSGQYGCRDRIARAPAAAAR